MPRRTATRHRERLTGGGWVCLHETTFPDHEARMRALLEELPLRVEEVVVFGRRHPTPRETSWHGDPGCAYAYAGRRFEPAPFTPGLEVIRARLEALEGLRFNSCLANLYRSGADAMGAHADDEPELGPTQDDVRIASVSFGAARRFVLKHRTTGETREYSLGEGSVLVMGGPLQRDWVHRVPRTLRPVGPRLNLTFRVVRLGPRLVRPCSTS